MCLRIERSGAEIAALQALDDEGRQLLVERMWEQVFAGAMENRTAIELEFSILLDGRMGDRVSRQQREEMLSAHRALLDARDAWLAESERSGSAPDPAAMTGWASFEASAIEILGDRDLWDELVY